SAMAANILMFHPSSLWLELYPATVQQCLRNGPYVHIFQFAAERHAARDARGTDAARPQHLGDVVRRRFAFVSEIGGENHLLHQAVSRPSQQPIQADVARSDA